MLTGREPAAGEPIGLSPEVPTELAAIVARTAGGPVGASRSAADLGHDLDRFLASVRPGAAPTAAPDVAPGYDQPAMAAAACSPAAQLMPMATARPPDRRVASMVRPPPARRRRGPTLAVGLVGGGLVVVGAAAVGLLGREPPPPVTNQALAPASTAIPATTTSQSTTSRAPATTTTLAGSASPPATSPQTTPTGQGVGPSQRIVPDVVGLHRKQAAGVLAQAQLGIQTVLIQVNDSGQVQRVVAQQPSAGHVLPAGSKVTVLVGTRRPTT
jgi:hypothetical protein